MTVPGFCHVQLSIGRSTDCGDMRVQGTVSFIFCLCDNIPEN